MIGAGSLFPAYIYAIFEERWHLDQVAAFKKSNDAAAIADTQKQLSTSNSLLTALYAYSATSSFGSVIESIDSARGKSTIQSFSLERSGDKLMSIVITGVSPTRDDLIALKDSIGRIPNISNVDLPISSLAKDTNIDFSMKITKSLQ